MQAFRPAVSGTAEALQLRRLIKRRVEGERGRARRPHAGLRDHDVAADARLAGEAQGAVAERRLAALLGQRLALCPAYRVQVIGALIDRAGAGRADALGAAGRGPVEAVGPGGVHDGGAVLGLERDVEGLDGDFGHEVAPESILAWPPAH